MPDTEKVNIYIDGSNLYHTLKEVASRVDIDFARFAAKLANSRKLVRVYYYNAPVDQTKEANTYGSQQKFFQALRNIDYFEVILGRLIYRQGWPNVPSYEKGIDIKIATDMLVHGHRGNYDVAVLVSADTDFADAIQAVKDLGHHVEVALFSLSGSQKLREVADRVIPIDSNFLSNCWR